MVNPASQVAVGPFEGKFWLTLRQAAPDRAKAQPRVLWLLTLPIFLFSVVNQDEKSFAIGVQFLLMRLLGKCLRCPLLPEEGLQGMGGTGLQGSGVGETLSLLCCKEGQYIINTSAKAKTLCGRFPRYLGLGKIPSMAFIPNKTMQEK